MSRLILIAAAVAALAGAAAPAMAQTQAPPPAAPLGVEVTQLAAPDAFTTPGRATGLAPTLWAGTSGQTARTVLPLLAAKPLSLAAAALARRILATGAPGPEGAARDPELAAARANALMFQGDLQAAAAVLAHAPALERNSDVARAAAETALLTGDDARACQVADRLVVGRDEIYWLKLRTYCQVIAGQPGQAQLTFDLVQAQVKDPIFTRLMGARLSGAGKPGAASLRNGLDYALSRSLRLDLGAAKPSPAVAAALAGADPTDARFDGASVAPEFADVFGQIQSGRPVSGGALIGALNADVGNGGKAAPSARWQAFTLLVTSLDSASSAGALDTLAQSTLPEGRAPLGRNLALEVASTRRLIGETALLALWTCAEAGPGGISMGDRIRIVRALHAVGLNADARAFVLEGLVSLK